MVLPTSYKVLILGRDDEFRPPLNGAFRITLLKLSLGTFAVFISRCVKALVSCERDTVELVAEHESSVNVLNEVACLAEFYYLSSLLGSKP